MKFTRVIFSDHKIAQRSLGFYTGAAICGEIFPCGNFPWRGRRISRHYFKKDKKLD
jgi:hypothetical protein